MAVIKPIRALRYTERAGKISDNVCPPYDIVSPAEREALIAQSEYNLIRLELPEGGEDRYKRAGELLGKWCSDGILKRDEEEGIFIYEEEFDALGSHYVFDGIVCLVRLEEFDKKIVLPHEETLKKAKEDRFNLMKNTFCNFSSVYSLYLDEERKVPGIISTYTAAAPETEFTDSENVTHRLWKITDKDDISAIQDSLADKQLFIADGHHRYETALRFRDYVRENKDITGDGCDYIMMTLVDMDNDGLVVFPTHRLIRDMDIDFDSLREKCLPLFEITDYPDIAEAQAVLKENSDGHAFVLYTGGEGFTLLRARKEVDDMRIDGKPKSYSSLDVSVLHSLILEGALGIDKENMANQVNLRYTRSFDEAVESVRRGESVCAFIINPTKIKEIKAVAEDGEKMPQKSTYFYPKLKTGLVINKLL